MTTLSWSPALEPPLFSPWTGVSGDSGIVLNIDSLMSHYLVMPVLSVMIQRSS